MKSGNWKTAEIPGKGIGMLAARDLQPGDLVTAYTPTFLAYLESDLSTADRESWWRKAIEQLPRERRDAFMNLTYVYGDPRVRVQDIVKANTFSIEIEGKNHLAIFPETSRLNHACNPKYFDIPRRLHRPR
jgi:ribosomal RNA assembly protein